MSLATVLTDPNVVQPVEQFFQRADVRGTLNLLRDRLPASARILVVGGSLRNLLIEVLHGLAPVTRDIDIFVEGLDSGFPLGSRLRDQQIEQTDLKGVRWHPLIDFNSRIIPDKRLMAYRILLMGHKTGFIFSEPVFQYVRNRLELETLTELKKLFTAKVGKTKAAIIMESYTQLCRFHSYEDYRTRFRR